MMPDISNTKDVNVTEGKISDMKHPLQNAWTLWYCRNDRSKNWEDNLKEVCTAVNAIHRHLL